MQECVRPECWKRAESHSSSSPSCSERCSWSPRHPESGKKPRRCHPVVRTINDQNTALNWLFQKYLSGSFSRHFAESVVEYTVILIWHKCPFHKLICTLNSCICSIKTQYSGAQQQDSRVWTYARWTAGAGQRCSPPSGHDLSLPVPVVRHLLPADLHKSLLPRQCPPLVHCGYACTPVPAAATAARSASWLKTLGWLSQRTPADTHTHATTQAGGEVHREVRDDFYILQLFTEHTHSTSVTHDKRIISGKHNHCPHRRRQIIYINSQSATVETCAMGPQFKITNEHRLYWKKKPKHFLLFYALYYIYKISYKCSDIPDLELHVTHAPVLFSDWPKFASTFCFYSWDQQQAHADQLWSWSCTELDGNNLCSDTKSKNPLNQHVRKKKSILCLATSVWGTLT